MKAKPRQITIGSIGIFIVTVLTLTFLAACQGRFDKDDVDRQAQAKKGPAQVSVENGQTVLTLDTPTQNRLGLEVATLTATLTRAQVTLPSVPNFKRFKSYNRPLPSDPYHEPLGSG